MAGYNDLNSVNAYWQGRADSGSRVDVNAGVNAGIDRSTAEWAGRQAAARQYQPIIFDLKQRLVACRAVRDTLLQALAEVAPDHPLINPGHMNPLLQEVAVAAGETVQRWDDEV